MSEPITLQQKDRLKRDITYINQLGKGNVVRVFLKHAGVDSFEKLTKLTAIAMIKMLQREMYQTAKKLDKVNVISSIER